jgi:hypothetical protein
MSKIIASFDPSATTTGVIPLDYLSNGKGTIVVWNESNWTLDFEFPYSGEDVAPAWIASKFALSGPQNPLTWKQDKQVNTNAPPISNVWIVAYQEGESAPGVYPAALVRQTNIGGGTVTASNAISVTNTGYPAGTPVVFGQPVGDAGAPLELTNDGQATFGDAAHPGLVTVGGAGGNNAQLNSTGLNLTNALSNISVDLVASVLAINGDTSGSVQLYQYIQGTVKKTLIQYTNLKNSVALLLALPMAYTVGAFFQVGETQGQSINFKNGSNIVTCSVQNTIAAAGGTQSPETSINAWSQGQVRGAFGTVALLFTASAAGGFILLEGV